MVWSAKTMGKGGGAHPIPSRRTVSVANLVSNALPLGDERPLGYPLAWHAKRPYAGSMTRGAQERAAELDATWGTLMAAAQRGDRIAYERLLKECTPLIRRVARHQRVQSNTVDDVVQDVLLTLHRARHTYDPARSFSAWLAAIAQRRAIDVLRRDGRRGTREVHAPIEYDNHPDPAASWDEAGTADMRGLAVRTAVEQLPVGQREAIEALALRQLSLDEAAAVTGKTKGALKVNMHRALQTLRARFAGPVE